MPADTAGINAAAETVSTWYGGTSQYSSKVGMFPLGSKSVRLTTPR